MPTFLNANQALNLQEIIRSEFPFNFNSAEQRIKAYQYLLQKIDAVFDEKQEPAANALYASLDTDTQKALTDDRQSIDDNIKRLAQIAKLVVLPVVVDKASLAPDAKQQLQLQEQELDRARKQSEAEREVLDNFYKKNLVCWYLRTCEITNGTGNEWLPVSMAKNILGFIKQLIQLELLKEQNELLSDKNLPNDETGAKLLSAAASHQSDSSSATATAAKDLKDDPNHPELQIQKLIQVHKAKQILEAKKQVDFAELGNKPAIVHQVTNPDSKQNSPSAQLNINMSTVTPDKVRDAILTHQFDYVEFVLNNEFDADATAHEVGSERITQPLIYFAIHSHSLPMVKLLVQYGAEIKPEDTYGKGSNRAIGEAIGVNDTSIASYLLEKGATAREEFRAIPFLVKALENNNIALVEILIKYGASVAYAISYLFGHRSAPEELYRSRVQILMDYNIGADFYDDKILDKLFIIDISGINFVGMSIKGHPITRQMLVDKNLKGAENAIVTVADIKKLTDVQRRQALETRLQLAMQKYGALISNDEIVNLIPLNKAIERGDTAAVQARLSVEGSDPNSMPNNIFNDKLIPIVEAAEKGHIGIVKFLASHPKIDKRDFVAAYSAATELVDSKTGASAADFIFLQQSVTARDKKGNTLLHLAAHQGNLKQVITCIDRKANVNAENKAQDTPLLLILETGEKLAENGRDIPTHFIQIIKILLDNGADANQYYYSRSPLARAVQAESPEAIALLLPHTQSKDIIRKDYRKNEIARAPWYVDMIFSALSCDKWQIIWNLFKSYNINFSVKNERGQSLFHLAIAARIPDAIVFLLANGARPNITDKNGNTPLGYLLENLDIKKNLLKWEKVIILLVKYKDTAELPADLKSIVNAKIATTSLADFENDMKSAATKAAALVAQVKKPTVVISTIAKSSNLEFDAKQSAAAASLPSAAHLTAVAGRSSPIHATSADIDAKLTAKPKVNKATTELATMATSIGATTPAAKKIKQHDGTAGITTENPPANKSNNEEPPRP